MKHLVYGISLLAIAIMAVAGAMAASGRDVRENEADKALNTAVEQTLGQLKRYGNYEIGSEQELIADFQQALLLHISSDADIKVKILTADVEKGVLDVEVRQTYRTVKQKEKQAVCRKTVILEEFTEKRAYCIAEFLVDGVVYEKYSFYKGGSLAMPKEPRRDGSVFRGWKAKGTGNWFVPGMTAQEDITMEAVFQPSTP